MHGGDFDPAGNQQLVRDIALGIREFDTHSLHTAHCAPETSALDFWVGETRLQLNNVYTYNDIPGKAEAAYRTAVPFFLLESRYENEGNPLVQVSQLRAQAYQALLSGAMGQAFGNHPIWHFDETRGKTSIRTPYRMTGEPGSAAPGRKAWSTRARCSSRATGNSWCRILRIRF